MVAAGRSRSEEETTTLTTYCVYMCYVSSTRCVFSLHMSLCRKQSHTFCQQCLVVGTHTDSGDCLFVALLLGPCTTCDSSSDMKKQIKYIFKGFPHVRKPSSGLRESRITHALLFCHSFSYCKSLYSETYSQRLKRA